MTFPLHPNLIGVLSDATKQRLISISQVASEHSNDLTSQREMERQLISKDLGNPSESEASAMHQASSIAVSTYCDWLESGRRWTTPDYIHDHDLTQGTHYLRLDEFLAISLGSGEDLHLEGAFISSQGKSSGGREYAVTVLLSGDPGPRIAAMSLKELMQQQSNIVTTTWDADNQKPEIVFCVRPEVSTHTETVAGIGKIWSILAVRLGYGEFIPSQAQLKPR
ncbi:hypothetical protein RMS29_005875 [Agrobacterium rosae]|uniref:Uncharacterized protein n=1 Tax=Agrobacterium rosae TaxID=1972867 RepID=A0ABU4W5P8_9HYPH|nr:MULTISPECIES: hypothetical protein [Agrobacterium]MDR5010577.1 hypothetical protein [Agrobacterium tumefaciens]MDX8331952.1 hypothetical protein [Agrobacterium rosae]